MINGLVIYDERDVEKNNSYISWLIEEGKKYNFNLELILTKEINYKELKGNYDFAINRSRDCKVTYNLELLGIKVFNKYKFCTLGNDKLKSYDFIKSLNIKYPRVYRSLSDIDNNKRIIEKPKSGHGGIGIKILNEFDNLDFNKNVYQEFIEDYIGDIRFYIIDNKIVNCVIRKPKKDSFLSNFSKGGDVEVYRYSLKDKEMIDKILENIEIDFGGIDFLLLNSGEILFNEFEDAVGSRMLSYLGINNTMEIFLNHIEQEVKGMRNI